MEKIGYVSLWIGNSISEKALREYITAKYTEDGDAIDTEFEKDFSASYFDEDFVEAMFYEESSNTFKDLLEGCSYDDVVIPAFEQVYNYINENYNTILLIYNYQYDGAVSISENNSVALKFIGSVKYH
jgi:hypothetical protein